MIGLQPLVKYRLLKILHTQTGIPPSSALDQAANRLSAVGRNQREDILTL